MKNKSAILGAAFLMATSAIGPGFLTQTSLFTQDLLASFGFVILISALIDIAAQVNIWQIITQTGKRAQDIANGFLPGLGFFLAGMIAFGGLIFNIGNIAGTGMGANVLSGLPVEVGAIISAVIAILIFWMKEAAKLIDVIMKSLGLLMIGLTVYVVFVASPPVGEALYRTVWPEKIDFFKIITIVGGTIGGYISFSGAHRLLDAGIAGKENKKEVRRSAVTGILVTSLMRAILFLAVLGVVSNGTVLTANNPAATVFQAAAGTIGYIFFGIVLWIAAITSVIGASYTSVSFWKTLSPFIARNEKWIVTFFILLSLSIFLIKGNPVQLLVLAGAVNGLILPIALAVLLLAASRSTFMKDYKHPLWLTIAGWVVVIIMSWMGYAVIEKMISQLFG